MTSKMRVVFLVFLICLGVNSAFGAPYEQRRGTHSWINPLLECLSKETQTHFWAPFRVELQNYVKTLPGASSDNIGIYFRDLNNGPWFGLNEDMRFTPASLLKVSVMIYYFKLAEQDPKILTHKIKYMGTEAGTDNDPNIVIQTSLPLEKGSSYTIDELIYRMIVYSDNVALIILQNRMVKTEDDQIFKELRLLPIGADPYTISAKDYSTFFRVLYNASYLNQKYSEKALEYLQEVKYKGALAADLPKEISVAHKFGERNVSEGKKTSHELHDCGIIYYPNQPYLLCVMTRGDDFRTLEKNIRSISSFVFQAVAKRSREKKSEAEVVEYREKGKRWTSPLIECESDDKKNEGGSLNYFQNKLKAFVESWSKDSDVVVSVYFRDLNNGPWFGLQPKRVFPVQNLLKLPLAMHYYKRAASEPELLSNRLHYVQNTWRSLKKWVSLTKEIEPDSRYTVEDLLFRTLNHDDTAAGSLLLEHANRQELDELYQLFDLKSQQPSDPFVRISPKDYSRLYLALYNSSYLNGRDSINILRSLAMRDENRGLKKLLPESVQVAHDEEELWDRTNNLYYHHDCGIIYDARYPYLLCVMAEGKEARPLQKVVEEISRFCYEQVQLKK